MTTDVIEATGLGFSKNEILVTRLGNVFRETLQEALKVRSDIVGENFKKMYLGDTVPSISLFTLLILSYDWDDEKTCFRYISGSIPRHKELTEPDLNLLISEVFIRTCQAFALNEDELKMLEDTLVKSPLKSLIKLGVSKSKIISDSTTTILTAYALLGINR